MCAFGRVLVVQKSMSDHNVIGQDHIEKHFQNAIKSEKKSHAYIINGEEGSGKSALALEFAKALQCEQNAPDKENVTGTACNKCKSCSQTDSGNQPDIKTVIPEKNKVGIDDIRYQINNDIEILPYSSPYKIYIIPHSETMTTEAQNALLKTIEEPPAYAIIILLTTNIENFLPTIMSRCVVLNIRPVEEDVIAKDLKDKFAVSDYEAELAVAFAGGNVGQAEKLIESEEFSDIKSSVVNALTTLRDGGMEDIKKSVDDAKQYKTNAQDYLDMVRMWMRDVLMLKTTYNEESVVFKDDIVKLKEMAEAIEMAKMTDIFEAIEEAEFRVKSNANYDATIEMLLLKIKEGIQ